MNCVVYSGRLTREAELKYTPNGKAVCTGAIAVNRSFNRDEADFFDFEIWGKFAESLHPHLRKGKEVTVSGWNKQDTWEKDGQKRSRIKLVVQDLDFHGKKEEGDVAQPSEKAQTAGEVFGGNEANPIY